MDAPNGALLAAGRGTRLHPLTAHRPKPLVPLAGRPLLSWGLDALRAAGVRRIGINAHHLGQQVVEAFEDDPTVTVVSEPTLLGTGGGIRGIAAALPEGPLVAINGDALFGFPIGPVIARHRGWMAHGTLALRHVPASAPFGRVGIDWFDRIQRIAEIEGPGAGDQSLRLGAFTGVQVLEPELLAAIPDGECDILRSAWRQQLHAGAPLYGAFVEAGTPWFDVGTIERYLDAHLAVLDGLLPAPHLTAPDEGGRRIHPTATVHSSAQLVGPCAIGPGAVIGAGARIGPHVFVDAEAEVAGESRLAEVVLWPRTRIAGHHRRLVVTPDEHILA